MSGQHSLGFLENIETRAAGGRAEWVRAMWGRRASLHPSSTQDCWTAFAQGQREVLPEDRSSCGHEYHLLVKKECLPHQPQQDACLLELSCSQSTEPSHAAQAGFHHGLSSPFVLLPSYPGLHFQSLEVFPDCPQVSAMNPLTLSLSLLFSKHLLRCHLACLPLGTNQCFY